MPVEHGHRMQIAADSPGDIGTHERHNAVHVLVHGTSGYDGVNQGLMSFCFASESAERGIIF